MTIYPRNPVRIAPEPLLMPTLPPAPAWHAHAACYAARDVFEEADTAIDRDIDLTPAERQDAIDAAKAICRTCPVIRECSKWWRANESGRTSERGSIYAGLTPSERARIDSRKHLCPDCGQAPKVIGRGKCGPCYRHSQKRPCPGGCGSMVGRYAKGCLSCAAKGREKRKPRKARKETA